MKFKRAMKHTIVIEPSANGGYYVRVGCCRLTYADPAEMAQDLRRFLADPELVEREYNDFYSPLEGAMRHVDPNNS